MAITKVTFSKHRPGTRFDPDTQTWIGYRIDTRIAGKRHVVEFFKTRAEAEVFIDRMNGRPMNSSERLRKLRELFDACRTGEIDVAEFVEVAKQL